jgi:carbamoyltransferase
MLVCGLKLTHDGSVAVIDNGRLLFNIEMEKLNNNKRYESIEDTSIIENVLVGNGISVKEIDQFAIDGWGGYDQDALAIQPRLEIGVGSNRLAATNNGSPYTLNIAQYHERNLSDDILKSFGADGLKIGSFTASYNSYLHVTGHVLSAYCTSPFASNLESSFVLIWDGGMFPRLYYYNVRTKTVSNLGPIFLLIGNIYTIFSQHFEPFKVNGPFAKDDLSIAGRVMAYIAYGKVEKKLFSYFDKIYAEHFSAPMGFANVFATQFKNSIANEKYTDQDVLASFHVYLENLLIEKIRKKIQRNPHDGMNLCIAGGCALNIKWNSAVRNSGLFKSVYVPPFPNDSGSAIGAACATINSKGKSPALTWDVYSGPHLRQSEPTGWIRRDCSIKELATLLHETNEPVVFLNGRAELGPRALGNRSIVAAATTSGMKDTLNRIKGRESYRPVAPLCLEEHAVKIFEPGTPDPYMLFEHQVKAEWKNRIPAVCHLDGTARLQTVNRRENKNMTELLEAYMKQSGIPLLCNTSANLNGRGFFPDVQSAANWDKANYIWSDNTLFERAIKLTF